MKVKLKSKLGRPFWRFGQLLSPDEWTEMDLSEAQLKAIEPEVTRTVRQGGTLEIDPNPWAKPAPKPAAKSQGKTEKSE